MGSNRTGIERLNAIQPALDEKAAFMAKLTAAAGDPDTIAFLMAEAVDMRYRANGLEMTGRDGRVMLSVESVLADHCLIAAAKAFREATTQGIGR